jgi:hypothetical protein
MATVEHDLDAEVLRQLRAVLERVPPDRLGAQMADQLTEAIPELQADEDFYAALVASCEGNLRLIWKELVSAIPTDPSVPPAGAIAWARDLAHRGKPLVALLRAYRLGHAFASQAVLDAAAGMAIEPEVRWRMLDRANHYFFGYVDSICTYLVIDYEQERARWIRGAAAAQAELVNAIVDGQAIEPREATETLRYDVSRTHLGFIVWSGARAAGAAPDHGGSLELAATALATALGGGPLLLIPIGERAVWGWTSGASLDPDADAARGVLPDGIRAAVGTPAAGIAGMASSHDEARAARRVGELLGVRSKAVVRYGAIALTALLTVEPAEAVRFAAGQLGELASDSDNMARLRATLRAYYEENLSPARAARRLGIHQNTVVYRVKRAEELLGRSVEDGRLELEVALRLSEGLDGLRAAAERRHAVTERTAGRA